MEEKRQEDFGSDGVDEFFGDVVEQEGEQPTTRTMAERELAAVQERLTTLGYQDGVDDGMQEAVQGGFDQGYAVGAAAGWEAGSLYGAAAAARAALVASQERPAGVGGARTAHLDTSRATDTLGGATGAVAAPAEAGLGSSTLGTKSVAATAGLEGGKSTGSSLGRRLAEESDAKDTAATAWATGGLQELVEELRHAVFLGPDGPGTPDRAEVLRRLRLVGPAGEAIADSLDDKRAQSHALEALGGGLRSPIK
eukprot:g13883.t1